MLNEKDEKKLLNLCTKMSNVFNDIYILQQGYVLSLDVEKPFIIQLDKEYIDFFEELCGSFKILHLWDIKKFKKEKDKDTYIKIVSSNSETQMVVNKLSEYIENINKCTSWENFTLSDDEDKNAQLLLSLFKNNDYINFKPNDIKESPDIILTKSLLPLVTNKNYTDLYYSTHKIDSDLFLIVFDFDFSLFKLYMCHYYIPIKK